ncbi:MAG: hypothetical protein K8F91_13080, partial [Candidatus Obscuribacterales bacterium]|nr:hypothetical protein [Candidatus Obscuribacterales bacterium]
GGIWHYAGTPYQSKTRMSGIDEIHIVKDKIFDEVSNEKTQEHVGFKSTVTVLRVEPGSSKIRESYQQESITRYEPVDKGTGIIKLFGSTKSFDQDGKPKVQTDNQTYVQKASPYARIDRQKGLDMHSLFRQFLIDSGRSNLLPD